MRSGRGLLFLADPLLAGTLLLVVPACGIMVAGPIVGNKNDRVLFGGVRQDIECILAGVFCMVLDLPLSFIVDIMRIPMIQPEPEVKPPPKSESKP